MGDIGEQIIDYGVYGLQMEVFYVGEFTFHKGVTRGGTRRATEYEMIGLRGG